ncbi:HlyD family efflux transporter periplasmic adaptor subunit [Clostridium cellulovorans]|uniref:Putative bacteriocin ABC transporter, bacteriocin-binding protein n=1 Tax=Clostridium cellulovorans (strain ATCC 35296 / DSM 3052 / OCM 3 / 743B) TaxID=573061 RepID=D9SSJ0_CLOC7|nr:HlyD family efflux transporter periplasmic adaptor subunit [Clostridium cellulovorans]ADL50587.1 putative bacteriocin ABC transporter, bacteriocin-binding protein [Clostridium cellulovorans 743B]
MRYKIENLNDITDSREIMQARPKGFSRYMMYIIIALLATVITWSCFAKKQITVKSQGVVRPQEEIFKVASGTAGIVTSLNMKEGMEVKKGDVLLVVNGQELTLQKNALEKNLQDKQAELSVNNKLKTSILDGVNHLNASDDVEGEYYKKYELYQKNLESGNAQVNSTEVQKNSIQDAINDLNTLLKSIEEEKNYFNKAHYMYYQYEDYEITLKSYKDQIQKDQTTVNKYEKDLNDLTNQGQLDQAVQMKKESLEGNIKTIKDRIDSTNLEITKLKNNQRLTVRNKIAEYEIKLKETTAVSTSNSYKEQYISQLDSTISSLENAISELKLNLDLAVAKVEATTIKAEYDGVINLSNELKVGDVVQNGTELAKIIPKNSSAFVADTYIQNSSFAEISEGKDVVIEFLALPQSEYGVLKAKLSNISTDAKIDQKQGNSYYTATCDIPVTTMTKKDGTQVDIKNGMLVQVRIISREITYMRYFLECLNIVD